MDTKMYLKTEKRNVLFSYYYRYVDLFLVGDHNSFYTAHLLIENNFCDLSINV